MDRLGPPIDARPLFAVEQRLLVELLGGLAPADWARPTACPGWTVQDVAAHVLGDHVGRLARRRDRHQGDGPRAGEAFPTFIHRINDEWVVATRRLSPVVLLDLLRTVGEQVVDHWGGVDLHELGEPVSWASPDPAPVWLDAARDHSEYWVHRRQIAEAMGRTGGPDPSLATVLDTFARALPQTLAHVEAGPGTTVELRVRGPVGGAWTVARRDQDWAIDRGPAAAASATVSIDADPFWRPVHPRHRAAGGPPAGRRPQRPLRGRRRPANRRDHPVTVDQALAPEPRGTR